MSGDHKPYLQIDRVEALVAAGPDRRARAPPLELPAGQPEVPGRLVFDLDPAPDVAFERVIEGAREMRDRLEALGLVSFCKTTGGKGLHVVTPLAKAEGDRLAQQPRPSPGRSARPMAADSPDRYLVNMAKKQRDGPDLPRLPAQRPHGDRGRALVAAGAAGRAGVDAADLDPGEEGARPARLHGPHRARPAEEDQGLGGLLRRRAAAGGRDQAPGQGVIRRWERPAPA